MSIRDEFSLFAGVLELNPHEKRGTGLLWTTNDDKGAHILGTSSPGRLNLVGWRVIFVGPRLDVHITVLASGFLWLLPDFWKNLFTPMLWIWEQYRDPGYLISWVPPSLPTPPTDYLR